MQAGDEDDDEEFIEEFFQLMSADTSESVATLDDAHSDDRAGGSPPAPPYWALGAAAAREMRVTAHPPLLPVVPIPPIAPSPLLVWWPPASPPVPVVPTQPPTPNRFPGRLVRVLSRPDARGVAYWDPSEKVIVVVDLALFARRFDLTLKSFLRQLYYYGFTCRRKAKCGCKIYANRDAKIRTLNDFGRLRRTILADPPYSRG